MREGEGTANSVHLHFHLMLRTSIHYVVHVYLSQFLLSLQYVGNILHIDDLQRQNTVLLVIDPSLAILRSYWIPDIFTVYQVRLSLLTAPKSRSAFDQVTTYLVSVASYKKSGFNCFSSCKRIQLARVFYANCVTKPLPPHGFTCTVMSR